MALPHLPFNTPHHPHLLLVQRLMAAISAADQAQAAVEAKAEAEAAQVKVLLACLDGGDRQR